MSRRRDHYQVLGVSRSATTTELHRAHRALVRRYHPDALTGADDATRAEAARRIREVNEAWRELRDPERRARYDLTLSDEPAPVRRASPYSPYPPGTEPEPPGGFDEWFADAEERRAGARVVERTTRPTRPFRARVLFGFGVIVLVGILLVVFITGPGDEGPSTGIGRGSCVRVNTAGPPTQVPCELPNDGRIVGVSDVVGGCPGGATPQRLSAGDTRLTCLAP